MEQHDEDCPECRNGKHGNCIGAHYDTETDEIVAGCGCQDGGHA